jgi:hypothetical protein
MRRQRASSEIQASAISGAAVRSRRSPRRGRLRVEQEPMCRAARSERRPRAAVRRTHHRLRPLARRVTLRVPHRGSTLVGESGLRRRGAGAVRRARRDQPADKRLIGVELAQREGDVLEHVQRSRTDPRRTADSRRLARPGWPAVADHVGAAPAGPGPSGPFVVTRFRRLSGSASPCVRRSPARPRPRSRRLRPRRRRS